MRLKGRYNKAIVFTNIIDNETIAQIKDLLDEEIYKDETIRVMPDTHAGKDCIIGLTMTITDKVNPALVGTDVGCGISAMKFPADTVIDKEELDKAFRHVSETTSRDIFVKSKDGRTLYELINSLKCKDSICFTKAFGAFGTLGCGNHFQEMGRDDITGEYYLFCHTGSRNLGGQIGNHYIKLAHRTLNKRIRKERSNSIVQKLKAEGREREIQKAIIQDAKENPIREYTKSDSYLTGSDLEDYLHDMLIAQEVSRMNREQILEEVRRMAIKAEYTEYIECIHNYIDIKKELNENSPKHILRKGAISSLKGERVLIPLNMSDGVIVGTGKGNKDWNYSAPHGAGRLYSRTEAREKFNLEEFKKSMSGVYSTCVSEETLDECPMAYKSLEDIVSNIGDSVEIECIIKPIHNYKSGEDFSKELKLKAIAERKAKREAREM